MRSEGKVSLRIAFYFNFLNEEAAVGIHLVVVKELLARGAEVGVADKYGVNRCYILTFSSTGDNFVGDELSVLSGDTIALDGVHVEVDSLVDLEAEEFII